MLRVAKCKCNVGQGHGQDGRQMNTMLKLPDRLRIVTFIWVVYIAIRVLRALASQVLLLLQLVSR